MPPQVKLRALIFEDDEIVRTLLQQALLDRGYEVFAFASPDLCPLNIKRECDCPLPCACADIILSDLRMPVMDGLEFIRAQRKKGCRVKFVALMSGRWTEEDVQLARSYDCQIFKKPFVLAELYAWLEDCERKIEPIRCLASLEPNPLKKQPPPPPGPPPPFGCFLG